MGDRQAEAVKAHFSPTWQVESPRCQVESRVAQVESGKCQVEGRYFAKPTEGRFQSEVPSRMCQVLGRTAQARGPKSKVPSREGVKSKAQRRKSGGFPGRLTAKIFRELSDTLGKRHEICTQARCYVGSDKPSILG